MTVLIVGLLAVLALELVLAHRERMAVALDPVDVEDDDAEPVTVTLFDSDEG